MILKNDLPIVYLIQLYFIQFFNQVFPFLVFPFLFIKFSLNTFGVFVFAQTFTQIITILVDYGYSSSAPRKIVEFKVDKIKLSNFYFEVIQVQLFLAIILLFFSLFFLSLWPNLLVYKIPVIISYLNVLYFTLTPSWFFQGSGDMRRYNLLIFFSKLIVIPFVIFVIRGDNDILKAIFLLTFSNLFVLIAANVHVHRKYFNVLKIRIISIKLFINSLVKNFPFFISSTSISIIATSSVVILGFFSLQYDLGIYGIVEKFIFGLSSAILLPINQTYFSVIANLYSLTPLKAKLLLRKILLNSLIISFSGLIILISSIKYIKTKFVKISSVDDFALAISFFTLVSIVLAGILGQLGFLATGNIRLNKIYFKVYNFSLFISLPMGVILIYFLKLNGALFYILISQSVIAILFLYYSYKLRILSI